MSTAASAAAAALCTTWVGCTALASAAVSAMSFLAESAADADLAASAAAVAVEAVAAIRGTDASVRAAAAAAAAAASGVGLEIVSAIATRATGAISDDGLPIAPTAEQMGAAERIGIAAAQMAIRFRELLLERSQERADVVHQMRGPPDDALPPSGHPLVFPCPGPREGAAGAGSIVPLPRVSPEGDGARSTGGGVGAPLSPADSSSDPASLPHTLASIRGSDNGLPIRGSDGPPIRGSDVLPIRGSDGLPIRGSDGEEGVSPEKMQELLKKANQFEEGSRGHQFYMLYLDHLVREACGIGEAERGLRDREWLNHESPPPPGGVSPPVPPVAALGRYGGRYGGRYSGEEAPIPQLVPPAVAMSRRRGLAASLLPVSALGFGVGSALALFGVIGIASRQHRRKQRGRRSCVLRART